MKKYGLILMALLWLTTPAQAMVVTCTNCSDVWTQAAERVTNLEQLQQMISQYNEMIKQTQQQIELVKNNIQQYENMVKNTLNLPQNLLNEMKGEFSKLANLTNTLSSIKGDVLATGEVFDQVYPGLDLLKNMPGGADGLNMNEMWEEWSKEVDEAAKATFQLTGSQLKDIADNSAALDSHLESLLSTPEGQMQAIQSGNSLAAIQVDELRQLRTLMAVSIQATTQMSMKDEKKEQATNAFLDEIFDVTGM